MVNRQSWLQNTTELSGAGTLDGNEVVRVIDDPSGTPTSKKTTVDGLSTRVVTNLIALGIALEWMGDWLTATGYDTQEAVANNGSSYICTVAHTSGASTEPGVGADWATVWDLIASKGDIGDVTAEAELARDEAEAAQAAAEAALSSIEIIADANYYPTGTWPTTAAGLGNGIQGAISLVGGSSGTNGTFPLIASGGTEVLPVRGYFVVAGNAVTEIVVLHPGYYTSNPTGFTFSASTGLTGASATPVMGVNNGVGEFFTVPVADSDDALIVYEVTSGPAATEFTRLPSSQVIETISQTSSGQATPAVGTAWISTIMISPDDLIAPYDGYVSEFRCYGSNAGTLTVAVGRRFDSTKAQTYRSISYSVASGQVTVYPDLSIAEGEYVFFRHTGLPHYGGGASSVDAGVWYAAGNFTTDSAGTTLTQNGALVMQAGCTFEGLTRAKARISKGQIDDLNVAEHAFHAGYDSECYEILETSATNEHRFYHPFTTTAGTVYEIEIEHYPNGRDIMLYSNSGVQLGGTINTTDASIAAVSGVPAIDPEYECIRLGSGWLKSTVRGEAVSSATTNIQVRLVNSAGVTSYAGDTSLGAYIRSVSFRVAGTTGSLIATNVLDSAWTKQNVGTPTLLSSIPGITTTPSSNALLQSIVGNPSTWSGGKLVGVGSSITAQNSWLSRLGSLLSMDVTNLGTGGASLGTSTVAHYGSEVIYDNIASIPSDASLVILECGVNDFGDGYVTLGAPGDTTLATYYGALHAAVAAIYAQAPDCVLCITVPHSANASFANNNHLKVRTDGATLFDFQNANDYASRRYGLPLLDYGREAGINYWSAGDYTSDGLHPNSGTGGNNIAKYFFRRILQLTPRP